MRVVLELAEANGPICGTISINSDGEEPFYGWIELASRLEGIRAHARDAGRLSAGAA